MTCGLCFDQGDATSTVKCLLNALESIKAHVLMLQKTYSNDAKTISNLQTRNEKLHKALELKQKQIDSRVISNIHVDKKMKFSPIKKTDSPLPQSQNSLNMNIAINSFKISPSDDELIEDEDETIAETESATKRTPRKLCRRLEVKNVENVQPEINWMGKTPNSQSLNKLSLTRRSSKLKQTRLQFQPDKQSQQEAIEESPNLFTSLKQAKQSQTRSLLQNLQKRQRQRLRLQQRQQLQQQQQQQREQREQYH
ncbi:mRNA export factor GLE1 isoform X2 [Drosophila tropicalis]|uniref:mRNA export factor GLE1 isoform X2 n=1 Tax=Drosophila tropicalis TaxID=46794 RepID=UPI0035ABC881